MTAAAPQEVAERIADAIPMTADLRQQTIDRITSALAAAVAAETERCAKVAGQHMCNHVAAAIRAR